ncbi:hypothetical protein GCM10010174_02040 [Kutzneria viridogrisea]|uniref:Erythromycin esterase n=2 Tax=Kutzneria TaxID=43356 RepID=W5WAC7_9PSEU|nr:erythromycin esterase family protein [Kutzneria albida]AHH97690.1 hypothetical protein KALB_4328 [Kutzneria albida DSM 43870]MBA8924722.1 erythromycin esterase [Kutzneria viridogrisea]
MAPQLNATRLTTMDPDAPLDDLEPLRELIDTARVVAVGESAHFVREFNHARQRLLRFLVQRCGFSVLAYEYGFSEGFAVDRWLRGEEPELDETAVKWGAGELMHWLRDRDLGVRFAGLDLPAAGGTLLPALEPVADYLREVDPQAVPMVEGALRTAREFASGSAAAAGPAWLKLDKAVRDDLSARLGRLHQRLLAVEPLLVERGGQYRFDQAVHHVLGARQTDYMFRAISEVRGGAGLTADTSAREVYLADSLDWHLAHAEPGARVVLFAHNVHIQKTPVHYGGALATLPLGQHLARRYGSDYRAIAVTSTAEQVPDMELDPDSPVGFRVEVVPAAAPEPGSVEAAALAAGLGLSLSDLRHQPEDLVLDRIRAQRGTVRTPLREAFDAVLTVPTATVEPTVTL